MKLYKIQFLICEDDFQHVFGRKPTKDELDKFGRLCEKGIEAQVDWDIIYKCAREAMKED